ncbi:MAG: hypothetical protein FWC51_01335 [Proteobacteria bacterium]|nr:hypothetical protein [Pseudomonadota bacterium]
MAWHKQNVYNYNLNRSIESADRVYCSYIFPGLVQFIHDGDIGFHFDGFKGFPVGYYEPVVEEKPETELGTIMRRAALLMVDSFDKREDGKIDFGHYNFHFAYAVNLLPKGDKAGEIITLNDKLSEQVIATYPDVNLKQFFAECLTDLSGDQKASDAATRVIGVRFAPRRITIYGDRGSVVQSVDTGDCPYFADPKYAAGCIRKFNGVRTFDVPETGEKMNIGVRSADLTARFYVRNAGDIPNLVAYLTQTCPFIGKTLKDRQIG